MSTDYSQLKTGDRFRTGIETYSVLYVRNFFLPFVMPDTIIVINEENRKIQVISFDDEKSFFPYELLAKGADKHDWIHECTSVRTYAWTKEARSIQAEKKEKDRIKRLREDMIAGMTDEQREIFDLVEKSVETE